MTKSANTEKSRLYAELAFFFPKYRHIFVFDGMGNDGGKYNDNFAMECVLTHLKYITSSPLLYISLSLLVSPCCTVRSFVELVKFVFTIPGVTVFLSGRICQDPLEGFFGQNGSEAE